MTNKIWRGASAHRNICTKITLSHLLRRWNVCFNDKDHDYRLQCVQTHTKRRTLNNDLPRYIGILFVLLQVLIQRPTHEKREREVTPIIYLKSSNCIHFAVFTPSLVVVFRRVDGMDCTWFNITLHYAN